MLLAGERAKDQRNECNKKGRSILLSQDAQASLRPWLRLTRLPHVPLPSLL